MTHSPAGSKSFHSHLWSVRVMPGGVVLASGLHRAEAQGFARAWNRLEGDDRQRAEIVLDRAKAIKRRAKAG